MRLAKHADGLFEIILSWYRDIQLIQTKGDQAHLINHDCYDRMKNQQGKCLESLQKWIKEAALAVERSTPINMCLERLFLQLDLI